MVFLKYSDGLTRPIPAVVMVVSITIGFGLRAAMRPIKNLPDALVVFRPRGSSPHRTDIGRILAMEGRRRSRTARFAMSTHGDSPKREVDVG